MKTARSSLDRREGIPHEPPVSLVPAHRRWPRMLRVGSYVFKRAETTEEFEQIHCLNYRIFVDEIPQHPDPGTGRLIDKFHDKNAYFVALYHGGVVGMVSVHGQAPFSVADRLADLGILQAPGTRPLEVRLLAI